MPSIRRPFGRRLLSSAISAERRGVFRISNNRIRCKNCHIRVILTICGMSLAHTFKADICCHILIEH